MTNRDDRKHYLPATTLRAVIIKEYSRCALVVDVVVDGGPGGLDEDVVGPAVRVVRSGGG